MLIKKFSSIILTISFLLLIYTLYKSEIVWDGNNRNYYKTYYLISSILIFCSIITFFINDKIKQYLIITGISLVVSLYLFEGYLSANLHVSKNETLKRKYYQNKTGKKWDTRSKIEIYEDLKKKDNETVLFVAPREYLNKNYPILGLSGISISKTIHCNENGYYSIYQSDRYGFNNPDEEWDKKEIEYLLVGDSFAHGACVNRPNDIPSIFRILSNKSVLNLGLGNNGPLLEHASLREYLNSNVKKVIWIYYEGNDLKNLHVEIKEKILMNYLNDLTFTQNLKLKQSEINDLAINIIKKKKKKIGEKNKKKEIFKKKLINFINLSKTRVSIFPPPPPRLIPEFKKILELTQDLTNKNNSKLYFVYLPAYYRYKNKNYKSNYDLIKKTVNELNIPFIDIHKEFFEKEKNPLKFFPFEQAAHYNVEGYKKIGEIIYNFTKH